MRAGKEGEVNPFKSGDEVRVNGTYLDRSVHGLHGTVRNVAGDTCMVNLDRVGPPYAFYARELDPWRKREDTMKTSPHAGLQSNHVIHGSLSPPVHFETSDRTKQRVLSDLECLVRQLRSSESQGVRTWSMGYDEARNDVIDLILDMIEEVT